MRYFISIAFILITNVFFACAALASPPDSSNKQTNIDEATLAGSVIVDVGAKRRQVTAFIDTGATLSIMTEESFLLAGGTLSKDQENVYIPAASKTINLPRGNPIHVRLPTHNVSVKLSPFILSDTFMAAPEFNSFTSGFDDTPILLGLDFLSSVDFTIDYSTGNFEFSTPDDPVEYGGENLVIKHLVYFAGHTLNCVVDTGASDFEGVVIQRDHPEYSTLRAQFDKHLIISNPFSWTGGAELVYDPKGELFNFEGKGLLASFEPTNDSIKDKTDGCIIGNKLLRFGRFELRHSDNFFNLTGKLPSINYDRTGLQDISYYPAVNLFGIESVIKNSPADIGGIKSLDLLIAVNGTPVSWDARDEINALMSQDVGTNLKLSVQEYSGDIKNNPNPIRHINVTLANVLE